jgi:ADP-ribose pyrophosphatase YjhB (NUDIX family)
MGHIFVSYAHEDEKAVLELYHKLKKEGFHLWIDKYDILPGQDWESQIKSAIRASSRFLAFLSNQSVKKRGVVQKEIKLALETLDEFPENQIFLVPIRLDECEVPTKLSRLHWLNIFESGGYEKLASLLSMYKEDSTTFENNGTPLYPTNTLPKPSQLIASTILVIRKRHENGEILLKSIRKGYASGTYTAPTQDCNTETGLEDCAKQSLFEETGIELLSSRPVSLYYLRSDSNIYLSVGILVEKFRVPKITRAQALISDHWYEWKWYDLTKIPSPLAKETDIAIQQYLNNKYNNLDWNDIQPIQTPLSQLALF